MRFLHTADWHLGRHLFGARLLDDQAHLLDELVRIVRDTRPDALVIAGDVYDRAVPPAEAVELLDDTLAHVAGELGVPVLAIAGNHDGPERLHFGSRLLAPGRLHVAGRFTAETARVALEDEDGRVCFYLVPYVEPAKAREVLGGGDLGDHGAVMTRVANAVRDAHERGCRSVFVGHAFVCGGDSMTSEGERPLAVGGAERVSAAVLRGFDYVALGHLHRPHGHYSGALMAYGFDEAGEERSVRLVEMDGTGATRVETVPLAPRRRLRVIEGTIEELLRAAASDGARDDYVMARLADGGPVLDAMNRLRALYPNALHVERPALAAALAATAGAGDRRALGPEALFRAFFRDMTGEEVSDAAAAELTRALEEAFGAGDAAEAAE